MTELLGAPPRTSWVRALCDYNPFYLLSALCMLAGLFSLNDSLRWSPLPTFNLLALIVILNIYEFLLIAIAIFLARRGLLRDVATLLVLEAFFLADAGFLNAEAFTQDFELGLAINIFLFVLAAAKLVMVFGGLRIPLTDSRLYLVLVQIFILLVIPGVLKHVSDLDGGRVSPTTIYIIWWIVGLIPVLYLLLIGRDLPWEHRGIILAFIALPTISILAHLSTSNWVYKVRWQHVNLSPLILGLSVAIGASDWHVRSMAARIRTHLLLPIVAILLAMPDYYRLDFMWGGWMFTPLRLTLLAAAIVYWYGMFLHHHIYFGFAGLMCVGVAGMGHSPEAIHGNGAATRRWLINFFQGLVPRTTAQWGIVSVAASFVLLGLGLIRSLLRLPTREPMHVLAEDDPEPN